MAAQTTVVPGSLSKIQDGFFKDQSNRQLLQTVLSDLIAMRNKLDALNTLFLAHSHLATGATAQTSGPDNTTSPGSAATAPTVSVAPANVLTAL